MGLDLEDLLDESIASLATGMHREGSRLPSDQSRDPSRTIGPRRPAALGWLAALAVLVPAALAWWLVQRIDTISVVRLGESRLAFARNVQARVLDEIQGARLTIDSASRRPGLRSWVEAGDASSAESVLANILQGPVPLSAAYVLDLHGEVFARYPPDASPPDPADVTALAAGGAAVAISRDLLASAPLLDDSGGHIATLYGRLPLSSTLDAGESLRFGESGAVSLLTFDGDVIATADVRRTGRRLRAPEVLAALPRAEPAVLDYHAITHDRREFSVLMPVTGFPLAVQVSQAYSEAFLPSTRLQTALIVLGAIQLFILIAFAWVGVRLLLAYERELRQHADALASANSELEAFSYTVAHDLRAPLRAVDGYAQMLEEDHGGSLDADARRCIAVIRSNATRMGRLIDDLLALSRFSRQPLELEEVNSDELVRELVEAMRVSTSAAAHCRFEFGELPSVPADRQLIRQVWANLLENAVKYSAKVASPEIRVHGESGAGSVTFTVEDDGVGFDMAHAGNLFGVFQRLHHAEDYAGTGVGLAIVARIVARHGGRVWAESEPGLGARFHFSLPLREKSP